MGMLQFGIFVIGWLAASAVVVAVVAVAGRADRGEARERSSQPPATAATPQLSPALRPPRSTGRRERAVSGAAGRRLRVTSH
jgi:hypothetical protein